MTDAINAHTPGPWLTAWSKHSGLRVVDREGALVAKVAKRKALAVDSWNGAVLAAAPDMLAALQDLKATILPEYLHDHPGSYRAIWMVGGA